MIIIAGLDDKTNSLWPLRDKTLTEIPYYVLDFLFVVWSEKLLAGPPCGYWHHSYITLLRGTDTTGLEAAKRQGFLFGWKNNFKTHSVYLCTLYTSIFFPPMSPKTNSCLLFLQLYATLCLRWPPFIHLPSISLSPLLVPISPEGRAPLVLSEWTILSELISKESCELLS